MSGIATSAATAAIQAHSPGKAAEGRVCLKAFWAAEKRKSRAAACGQIENKRPLTPSGLLNAMRITLYQRPQARVM